MRWALRGSLPAPEFQHVRCFFATTGPAETDAAHYPWKVVIGVLVGLGTIGSSRRRPAASPPRSTTAPLPRSAVAA